MKEIKLNRGYALVDDKDFERYGKLKWHLSDTGYAVRRDFVDGKKKTIRLHREIMETPSNLFVDHINRNRLDNRKENLRNVTWAENRQNIGMHKDNVLKEHHIDLYKPSGLFRFRIQHFGKGIYSLHKTLQEAINVRNIYTR